MSMEDENWAGNYNAGWVTADGSYGEGGVILFDPNKISEFQYLVLDNLSDSERYLYINAVMNSEDLTYWERDYLVCEDCNEPISSLERAGNDGVCDSCQQLKEENN